MLKLEDQQEAKDKYLSKLKINVQTADIHPKESPVKQQLLMIVLGHYQQQVPRDLPPAIHSEQPNQPLLLLPTPIMLQEVLLCIEY